MTDDFLLDRRELLRYGAFALGAGLGEGAGSDLDDEVREDNNEVELVGMQFQEPLGDPERIHLEVRVAEREVFEDGSGQEGVR